MAKLLKLRRGTTSQHSSFTGAEGEVTVDTTKDTIVVHDGSTAGGTALAKESAVTAIPAVIDEDNMSSDSATRPPSQQSVKAYVDALPDVIDEDNFASNSATAVASQQSIAAYVAAQISGEDLDVTSDSGTIDVDLNSETLTIAGGTGLGSTASGTTVTLNIDSTVATLTGTQTLTNKTLTTPLIVDTGSINCGTHNSGANQIIIFDTVVSAVNEITISNGATGNPAQIAASGETNIGLKLSGKGTEGVILTNSTTNGAFLEFDTSSISKSWV